MIFIHIQYPIIDLRWFLKDEICTMSHLQMMSHYDKWIRNFGHSRERAIDTSNYFIAEHFYNDAHNAIKLESLPLFYYNDFDKICRFRRLWANGCYKVSWDIGVSINVENDKYEQSNLIYEAYKDLVSTKLLIKNWNRTKERVTTQMLYAGPHIAKLYAKSTSKFLSEKYVAYGKPTSVIVDYDGYDYSDGAEVLIEYKDILEGKVIADVAKVKKNGLEYWYIHPCGYHPNKQRIAALRRTLLSISQEKESLIAIYDFLHQTYPHPNLNIDRVLSYLKSTQEKLNSSFRYGCSTSNLVHSLFRLDIESNRDFYNSVINLSYSFKDINDDFILSDFKKLFVNIDFKRWESEIRQYINSTPKTRYTRFIKDFLVVIKSHDYKKFWAFVDKYHLDQDFVIAVASNAFTEVFKILIHVLSTFVR